MKTIVYVLLVFGILLSIGCLNYTKAFGVEVHYKFAAETGLPQPSSLIFYVGVAGLIATSATLGFLIGRQNRQIKSDE